MCTHMYYVCMYIHIIMYMYTHDIYTYTHYKVHIHIYGSQVHSSNNYIFSYPEPGAPSIFIISLLLNLNRLLFWESQKFSQFFTWHTSCTYICVHTTYMCTCTWHVCVHSCTCTLVLIAVSHSNATSWSSSCHRTPPYLYSEWFL